jgi:hypothetical protein
MLRLRRPSSVLNVAQIDGDALAAEDRRIREVSHIVRPQVPAGKVPSNAGYVRCRYLTEGLVAVSAEGQEFDIVLREVLVDAH